MTPDIPAAIRPTESDKTVSHETIYNAIYLHPRGELKRELIACLRHHNQVRKPLSRGTDRRGQIKDMQSIHIRPPEIEDRVIPCHWEGDLIKGEGNRSSVGTPVERTTRFVVLAKMDNAGTKSVVDSFSTVLNRKPEALRKSITYDQGREMHGHKILTERNGVQIYFADPHSPWQRGSNENTNGLLCQYMPKGSDLLTQGNTGMENSACRLYRAHDQTTIATRFNSLTSCCSWYLRPPSLCIVIWMAGKKNLHISPHDDSIYF
jgi:IS30 family transposase